MSRVRPFAAVFVAAILCAGLCVDSAVAQQTAACNVKTPVPCAVTSTTIITQVPGAPPPPLLPPPGGVAAAVAAPPPADGSGTTVATQSFTNGLGSLTNWQGLNWGVGLATDFDLSGKRVTNVVIDGGGLVRVTDSSGNVGISFVLEAHYFAWDWPAASGCNQWGMYGCTEVAVGPFVAVEVGNQSSNNNPINGYALGMMVGLHRPTPANADPTTTQKASNSTWNFGVGLRVDPSAQVLADGVVVGHAPPPGLSTSDLTKKEPRYGVMLMSSFSF